MRSFIVFLHAKYYSGVQIGENERDRACSTNSIKEKYIQGVTGKNGRKETVAKISTEDKRILKYCRLYILP